MNHIILFNLFFFGLILQCVIFADAKTNRGSHRSPRNHTGKSKATKKFGSKIVGGYETTIQDQPYQAYLLTEDFDGQYYDCGGSIISEEWILTAAHCMDGIKEVHVRLGSTNSGKGGQSFKTSHYEIHPDYDDSTTNNDVAVLKLKKKAKLNDAVKIIKINDEGKEVQEGTIITVSGWGVTQEDGDTPDDLRAVKLTVESRKQCEDEEDISAEMFCASDKGKDSCQGDSGGPAVEGDTKDNPTQVGIVSFGEGCAREGHPGVYTNIAAKSIRDFIREKTNI